MCASASGAQRPTVGGELRAAFEAVQRNRTELAVGCLSVLFLVLFRYRPLETSWQTQLLYMGVLPVLSIVLLLRRNPLDFGLRLGAYRVWALHLAVAMPVTLPLLWLSARSAGLQRYYAQAVFDPLEYAVTTALGLLGWEYLCRGFLLFGLRDRLKEAAIIVQMIPFTLLHFGKPEEETLACIGSGIYFGYLAYRGNSFWPAFLFHVYINLTLKALVVYGPS